MADAAPSNLSTQPFTPASTPKDTVNNPSYRRVGDHTFGSLEKQIDPSTPFDQRDAIRKAQIVEARTENVIRTILERDGLRLHQNDNWIKVMNRCKKNLYEIYEYTEGDKTEFHLFRKGRMFARVCPFIDYRNHIMFRVESC